MLLATVYLLQPAATRSAYYGHWTPRQRLEWYHGTVLSAHIGPIPLPSRAIERSDAVRESILRGGEIRVTALAGPPIQRLGSLFQISDYKEREVILLGPDRDDLVFRYRTRANEHRLRSPEIRVPRAFAGVAPGDTILVTARLTSDGFCVTLNQAARCPTRLSGLVHYLESLYRFQEWAVDSRLILNGHDEPITDLHAVTETIRQNIIRRIGQAINAMREPLTIAEICSVVYGETGGYNQLLVMEKTCAYVEYLYEHGMIEIANAAEMEQGQPARYRRLRDESVLMEELESKVNKETRRQVHT